MLRRGKVASDWQAILVPEKPPPTRGSQGCQMTDDDPSRGHVAKALEPQVDQRTSVLSLALR
jgi:hypothetical protein